MHEKKTLRGKIVFLDAAGTLFRLRTSVGEVYAATAGRFGLRCDASVLGHTFQREFHRRGPLAFPAAPAETIDSLERAWWRDLVRAVLGADASFDHFEEFFDELYEAFSSGDRWQLFPETLQVLVDLRSQKYALAVLSNFDSRLTRVLEELGIAGYFDFVLISSLCGAAKPAPEIFQMAAERVGRKPAELVHIGDSLEDDYRGAQNAGWRGILLDRGDKHTEIAASDRINSLTQIETLL